MYEFGENGTIEFNGKTFNNRTYIVMEYVDGPLLFDIAKQMGSLGEDLGRYFAKQLIDQLDYLNRQNIVHRDIKLENIIMDKNMNLKLADFGFATDEDVEVLSCFRGTQSYMAPEIRNGDLYNGKETDIFSMGVVLFTLVVGYFPFQKAAFSDKFYSLLLTGKRDDDGINTAYWKALKSSHLSNDFKELMQRMLGYIGNSRPTIEEIKEHPWIRDKLDSN